MNELLTLSQTGGPENQKYEDDVKSSQYETFFGGDALIMRGLATRSALELGIGVCLNLGVNDRRVANNYLRLESLMNIDAKYSVGICNEGRDGWMMSVSLLPGAKDNPEHQIIIKKALEDALS